MLAGNVDEQAAGRGRRRPLALVAALLVALGAAVTVLVAVAPLASAQSTTTYAYPSGTATSPCTATSADTADECDLQDAITQAGDGGTVVLEADPSGAATFTTSASDGFTVSQSGLTIEAAAGVAPTLEATDSDTEAVLYAPGTGMLSVQGVTIDDDDNGADGIYTNGALTVTDSTITGNGSDGIEAGGAVTVTDSTITGNGGGVVGDESVTVTDSTITGNGGDGIFAGTGGSVAGSIVAGNGTDCDVNSLTDDGYNLGTSGGGCGFSADTIHPDVIVTSVAAADLGALADNGGPTQTIGLEPGSPAIGADNSSSLCAAGGGTDQRGDPRPSTGCAIGAYEPATTYAYPSGTATSPCTATSTDTADECDLQDAITQAGEDGTVMLESDSSGSTFTATDGFTVSQDDLTIEAAPGVAPTLEATGSDNVLFRPGAGTLSVQDVTITGERAFGIFTEGSVTVTDSTITGIDGAGIDADESATVTDSTITGNDGEGVVGDDSVTVTDSTITGNRGDGIDADEAANVTDSTITGNGDDGVSGGESANVTDSTITGNGDNGIIAGTGGSVAGSIVAGNTPDCAGTALTDAGYNLGTSGGGCGFSAGTSDPDVIVTSVAAADLGALADNGGPTETAAPGSDSSAIGADGSSSLCAAGGGTDQRGVPRPASGCDIGAVQTVPTTVTVTPTASTVVAGGTITVDVTVASTLAAGTTNPALPAPNGSVSVSIGTATGTCDSLAAGGSRATATSTCTIAAPSLTTTADETVAVAYADTGTGANGYQAASGMGQVEVAAQPTITGISPPSGPTAGGTSVTITGTNLAGATEVDFGAGNPATVVSDTATSITVATPDAPSSLAGGVGALAVSVTTAGGSVTDAGAYTYTAAAALALTATPAAAATVTTPVTLQASVTGTAGGPTPTGTVTFAVAGDPSAGCANVTLTAGAASCALGDLPAGSYQFTATYSGDSDYTAGAPGSLSGYQVSKLTSAVTVASSVSAPVFGQPVSLTATVTSDGAAVSGGTVQWQIDGVDADSPVAVGTGGAVSLPAVDDLAVGSHTLTAIYSGDADDTAATGQATVVVAKARTTTTLQVTADQLTATVSVVAPGAGVPGGMVAFSVNGRTVGRARLSATGTATLAYRSSGNRAVAVTYGGDASFTASSASTATRNPTITATVSSSHRKSSYGWYRSPVTIQFSCHAGSAPLTAACPTAITLTRSRAGQSVTRTIHARDGGIATVTISPVNIDLVPPAVRVAGVRNGHAYELARTPRCVAHDRLSGVAACIISRHSSTSESGLDVTTVRYTARATDRAGNLSTRHGSYRVLGIYLQNAAYAHGAFRVGPDRSYTIVVNHSRVRPRYVDSAPAPRPPAGDDNYFYPVGPRRWAIGVVIPALPAGQGWDLGIQIGTTLHELTVRDS